MPSMSTKIVIKKKKKATIDENVEKEAYIDDEEQHRWATLLSFDTERKKIERESQDSDKPVSETRYNDDFNLDNDDSEREIDEAWQYMVYFHSEEKGRCLPRTVGTSRLNSHCRSSIEEKPVRDSIDKDWLSESQTLVVSEVPFITVANETISHPHTTTQITTIKPTISHKKNHMGRIIAQAKQNKVNPMSQQLQTLTEQLQQQKQRLDDLMTFKVPDAIEESVVAHIINEVKNQLLKVVPDVVADFIRPRIHSTVLHVLRTKQISLTTTPRLSTTNITIPELNAQILNMMSNDPYSIKGEINLALYKALCYSVAQDKRTSRKESCKDANLKKRPHDNQDPPENPKGGEKHKKQRMVANMLQDNKSHSNQLIMIHNRVLLISHENMKNGSIKMQTKIMIGLMTQMSMIDSMN
ncbi:hypothetical protein Tco_0808779 [Tanacetum coccineum]